MAGRVERLRRELDPLPAPVRARRVAALGRSPDVAELLAGGPDERRLGVLAAAAAGDGAAVARALFDPAEPVRFAAAAALRYAPVPDDAIVALVADAPYDLRRLVLRTLARTSRTALAEQLLDPVLERFGAAEAAMLLPACGPATVAARLPELAHAVRSWARLGRRHPAAVLDAVEEQLPALPPRERQNLLRHAAPGIAATGDPGRLLALLETCRTLPAPLRPLLPRLLAADPARTVRLLALPEIDALGWPSKALLRGLARLPAAELAVLLPLLEDTTLSRLLRALPPSRRSAAFDAATRGLDLTQAELEERILRALPRERAAAEARRMLGLRPVRASRPRVAQLTAYLPPAEARDVLLADTRSPEVTERAAAYGLLVANAARTRDPAAFGAAVAGLERLRTEVDPVRAATLTALAAVPPWLFAPPPGPPVGPAPGSAAGAAGGSGMEIVLERLGAEALAARDCSVETGAALALLAVRQVGGPLAGWALRTLGAVAARFGRVPVQRLHRRLPAGQEHAVFAAVRPALEAEAGRDSYGGTLDLATSLGRRGWAVEPLQALVGRATVAPDDRVVRQAVTLWLEPPATRWDRVEQVLRRDASTVALPRVLATLATGRTDLLDRAVLARTGPRGRFASGRVRVIPLVERGTDRWTAGQRVAYAGLLAGLTGPTQPAETRLAAVRMLGRLGAEGAPVLGPLVGSADPAVGEASLAALARGAPPETAVGVLLAEAGTDRARVVVGSLERSLRRVPPSHLPGLLGPLLTGPGAKVTVRKEAARLLARLRAPGATDLLLSAGAAMPGGASIRPAAGAGGPGVHPDVRAAAAAALTDLPDDERAWAGVLGAAGEPSREPAWSVGRAVAGRDPFGMPERHRARYADLLGRLAGHPDDRVRAVALMVSTRWVAWSPELVAALGRRAADLDDAATWRRAVAPLAEAALDGTGGIVSVVEELLAAADGPDAGAGRDLPARRRLTAVVTELAAVVVRRRAAASPAVGAVTGLLARDPSYLPSLVELELTRLPADLAVLDRLADLLAARPAAAVIAAAAAGTRLGAASYDWRPEDLLAPAARLTARADLAGGLLAAAVAGAAGGRAGWPDAWRDTVRALRRHPDPDVRQAALALTTAAE